MQIKHTIIILAVIRYGSRNMYSVFALQNIKKKTTLVASVQLPVLTKLHPESQNNSFSPWPPAIVRIRHYQTTRLLNSAWRKKDKMMIGLIG